MIMTQFKIAVLCCCCWFLAISNAQRNSNHRYRISLNQQMRTSYVDIKDKIIELQCYAKCGSPTNEQHVCHTQCLEEVMREPRRGQCPDTSNNIYTNISPLQKLSCLDSCKFDFDCAEVQKCCASSCGPICMDPIGLQDDTLLPPIPKILKYKLPRSHKVELTIESSANSSHFWNVEARYHIGQLYSARKLGAWHWQPVEKIAEISDTKTKRTDICFNLRPGRWYQVRVAAINVYGFRGYSEPSKAFTLRHSPKPPKAPSDLKVVSKKVSGHNISVKIVWCPAKSNLPIEKYKIIWSLYVRKTKEESLITNETYVKNAHQFEINNLIPDSSYYIQVQAMSISGSRRLKSEKKSVLFNSTVHPLESFEPLKCASQNFRQRTRTHNRITSTSLATTDLVIAASSNVDSKSDFKSTKTEASYSVHFRMNRIFGMVVQISGFTAEKQIIYELCEKDSDCEQNGLRAFRATKSTLDFNKLKYNTTYVLKPLQLNHVVAEQAVVFSFTTPKCENFKKRFTDMNILC